MKKPFASGARWNPPSPPLGTAANDSKNFPFASSLKCPGASFSHVMLGVVPAATSTVRAGSVTVGAWPGSGFSRLKIIAFTAPFSSATASIGLSSSAKEIPSSSALITSSWFSRYAGESTIRLRYAIVTPPHARTSGTKLGASPAAAARSRSARTSRPWARYSSTSASSSGSKAPRTRVSPISTTSASYCRSAFSTCSG